MSGTIRTEETNDFYMIRISNEGKRNALTPEILSEIEGVFSDLGDDTRSRPVIVRGRGDAAFSSGLDVSTFDGNSSVEADEYIASAVNEISEYPYPTIAMINGDVHGGAVEVALSCDLRIAASGANVSIPAAKLGLVYPKRPVEKLLNIVGPAETMEMLYTGDPVSAEEAASMGLFNRVVDSADLGSHTRKLATDISNNAPLSLFGTKMIVKTLTERESLSKVERELLADLVEDAAESEDHKEGVEAFKEGRNPKFTGE